MRVAVLEFLTGGGLSAANSSDADKQALRPLFQEGLSMLSALSLDLAECGHKVHLCLDQNLATEDLVIGHRLDSNQLRVHSLSTDWIDCWIEIASLCDRTIVIAPELDQQLEQTVSRLRSAGIDVVASSDSFIRATSDKLATAKMAEQAHVPHPKTSLLSDVRSSVGCDSFDDGLPLTLKRRDGAGCAEMIYFENSDLMFQWLNRNHHSRWVDGDWIVQGWQTGIAASMAVIAELEWQIIGCVEQSISMQADSAGCYSRVEYRGGRGPVESVTTKQLNDLLSRVRKAFPSGGKGWIGIDFIIPNSRSKTDDLVLVEVNPRLTTSYLGYRQWYGPRIADCILGAMSVAELKCRRTSTLERISF